MRMLHIFCQSQKNTRDTLKGLIFITVEHTDIYTGDKIVQMHGQKEVGCVFRSISCGQWKGQPHHTPAC